METVFVFLMLLVGFVLLVWGSDFFVEGAAALAKKFGISPLIVGLTVVAFGTSAPELTVSVTAGMKGANELAVSNVIGSNLFNLLVVIGGCAIFSAQSTNKDLLKRDWPLFLLSVVVFGLMIVFDRNLSRVDGLLLLAGFFVVIGIQIKAGLAERKRNLEDNEGEEEQYTALGIWVRIILGCIAIVFGGEFCVTYASAIATMFGLSETIIGLTVVSVGTSLPELVTSVAATRRGEKDMAIGNVVGSNLFNVLLILSVSAALNPIPVRFESVVDVLFLLMMSVFVFFLAKKDNIKRNTGIAMLGSYLIYMVFVVYRDVSAAIPMVAV
ncbi:MAG: calcium/sodium antiporter [Eubacteriales bacterium]